MTQKDSQAIPTVVIGMITVAGQDANVLLDLRFAHSFVSFAFSMHLDKPHTLMTISYLCQHLWKI